MTDLVISLNRARIRMMINSMLLGATVSMFSLVASLQGKLLRDNVWLAIQIVLAIPLFATACITSALERKKETERIWYNFSWFNFIIGYAFAFNSIGIIISAITSVLVGMVFFATSISLFLFYSLLLILVEGRDIKERIVKDSIFIIIQLVMGVLVILKYSHT